MAETVTAIDAVASLSLVGFVFAAVRLARGAISDNHPNVYFYMKEVLFLTALLTMQLEIPPVVRFMGPFGYPTFVVVFCCLFFLGLLTDGATGNPAFPIVDLILGKSGATTAQRLLTIVLQVAAGHSIPAIMSFIHTLPLLSSTHLRNHIIWGNPENPLTVSPIYGAVLEGLGLATFKFLVDTLLRLTFLPMLVRVAMLGGTLPVLNAIFGPYTGLPMRPSVAHAKYWYSERLPISEFVLVYWVGPVAILLVYTVVKDALMPAQKRD